MLSRGAPRSLRAYYEPFGRRIERSGTPLDGSTGELRLGLTGHEHDDELGLINLNVDFAPTKPIRGVRNPPS